MPMLKTVGDSAATAEMWSLFFLIPCPDNVWFIRIYVVSDGVGGWILPRHWRIIV